MLVEIFSDVVCPWCYVGKRRFEVALARYDGAVQVEWRAFQLDPRAPREPQPVADAYARKFGERAEAIMAHLAAVAAEEGIEMRFDRAMRVNTIDAHRVCWLAGHSAVPGVQSALEERLMRAYFTEGLDVSDRATLCALAADCGLDPNEVGAMLHSQRGVPEVHGEIARAAELDVMGVPSFVFERRFVVPGAQDPETFLRLIEMVAARAAR
ncbi:MAG: DsbA family oxidoreductase [Actinobacteria bacterium]|nr:DsbA family oxidoreductase [Actinomycetota bacterium]